MDDEIFPQDTIETNDSDYQKEDNKICKINFSVIRTFICTFILIVLALLKHFNYANYQQFGVWYNTNFKIETFNANTVKNFTFDKFHTLQEIAKSNLENLINK